MFGFLARLFTKKTKRKNIDIVRTSCRPSVRDRSTFSNSALNNNIVSSSVAERRLIAACFGDSSKAVRLIDYEVKRSMGLSSRSDAALAALDRLERDRSR